MSDRRGWLATELNAAGSRGGSSWVLRDDGRGVGAARQLRRRSRSDRKTEKPVLVWLEFQDCAGNTEAFLRASRPTAAEVMLDMLSVDYHETIMAAAGHQAEEPRHDRQTARRLVHRRRRRLDPDRRQRRLLHDRRRAALDIAREVCGSAAATIAIGTCAAFGGIPAASPNPTGALGWRTRSPAFKNLDQPVGVPGQRREPHRAARLLPHLQALAAARSPTAGRSSPTASRSTTTASGARTTTPASTSRSGATRGTARATASTRWAARGR